MSRHATTTVFLHAGQGARADFLNGPPPLSLRRTPPYLRFVVAGDDWQTLDALDQLDDEPRPGERIIAARRVHRGTMHIDLVRGRRRVGEWHRTATYEAVADAPPQDVLRDTRQWRAWCLAQDRQTPKKETSN